VNDNKVDPVEENRLTEPDADVNDLWVLRLYIVSGARNSLNALANLQAILQRYLSDRYRLEVVDILENPQRALEDGILVTPTLDKLAPLPVARIAGSLSQTTKVLAALGLASEESVHD
jgi:circadian clock protein KaiB